MDQQMNHSKWKINIRHVLIYLGSYVVISFTDIYLMSASQNFSIEYEHLPELDAKWLLCKKR